MSAPGTSTSGAYAPNPILSRIITNAYLDLGVVNEDETPTAGMFEKGRDKANALVKEWFATGIHVWTEEEAVLFMQPGQVRYLLGGDTDDHCADAFSYGQTCLNSNAAAGATSLLLVDGDGFDVGDQFGLVLDSGSAFWTTITAALNNAVTIADGLPSSASAQNFAFSYLTDIVRPLRVPFARRIQWATPGAFPIETPFTDMMSRQEYMNLPNKFSLGQVTQAFYNPGRDQGELFVWPAPQNAAAGIRFTWYRPIQAFFSGDDQPDFPVEWENAIEWNLAKDLGLGYSVPADRWDRIKMMAQEKFQLVSDWDREFQSMLCQPADDQTRG